ncbi:MAG: 50S ribosomal protein L11 methyltransferase [Betaproteobacteria bacterium]|nr:50S ribosomal protein L11 methyltransferase [Betaproteobacteria bacterium]
MAWLSIRCELQAPQAEALSEALLEAGADSVDLEPGAQRTRITALAAADLDPRSLLARAAQLAGVPAPEFLTGRVENEDWVRRSQAQFGPLRIAERLWIVPSWHAPPDAAALVVRLDPGLAFGTGSHPSTRLVLRFLERNLRGGERVLDYGCGSGILAIAAARLGAGEVAAVDSDPQAIEVAAQNAHRNGVALGVSAPGSLPAGTYDILVANILANPLIALETALAARLRRRGRIALSGILEPQAAEVLAAYSADFECAATETEEGWVLLEGGRR